MRHPRPAVQAIPPEVPIVSPPGAPTGLAAVVSGQSVTLTWGPPATGNAQVYRVYRGVVSGTLAHIATTIAPTHVDTTVSSETTYYYAVSAIDHLAAEGAQTSEVIATTPVAQLPAPVVTATPGYEQVMLTWPVSPAAGVNGYHITWRVGPFFIELPPITLGVVHSYVFTGLGNGIEYRFRVQSLPGGEQSTEVSATPLASLTTVFEPPPPPLTLSALGVGSQVNLSWAAVTGSYIGYRIYRDDVLIASVGPSTTTYADTAVVLGTTYSYVVTTYTVLSESTPSPVATGTPAQSAPLAPVAGLLIAPYPDSGASAPYYPGQQFWMRATNTGGTASSTRIVTGDAGDATDSHEVGSVLYTYGSAATYSPSVTLTNQTGTDVYTATGAVVITALPAAPTAAPTCLPTSGTIPLTVACTLTPSGSWHTAVWDMGDGTMIAAQNPSHTYKVAGSYTPRVTITGLGGSNTYVLTSISAANPSGGGTGQLFAVTNSTAVNWVSHPVGVTVPCARGADQDAGLISVETEAGVPLASSVSPLVYWDEGGPSGLTPLRAAHVVFPATVPANSTVMYRMLLDQAPTPGALSSVTVGSVTTVDTGAMIASFRTDRIQITSVSVGGTTVLTDTTSQSRIDFALAAQAFVSTGYAVTNVVTTIEVDDSYQCVIKQTAYLGVSQFRVTVRWFLWAGRTDIGVQMSVWTEKRWKEYDLNFVVDKPSQAIHHAYLDLPIVGVGSGTVRSANGDFTAPYRMMSTVHQPGERKPHLAVIPGTSILNDSFSTRHLMDYYEGPPTAQVFHEEQQYNGAWGVRGSAGGCTVGMTWFPEMAFRSVEVNASAMRIGLFPDDTSRVKPYDYRGFVPNLPFQPTPIFGSCVPAGLNDLKSPPAPFIPDDDRLHPLFPDVLLPNSCTPSGTSAIPVRDIDKWHYRVDGGKGSTMEVCLSFFAGAMPSASAIADHGLRMRAPQLCGREIATYDAAAIRASQALPQLLGELLPTGIPSRLDFDRHQRWMDIIIDDAADEGLWNYSGPTSLAVRRIGLPAFIESGGVGFGVNSGTCRMFGHDCWFNPGFEDGISYSQLRYDPHEAIYLEWLRRGDSRFLAMARPMAAHHRDWVVIKNRWGPLINPGNGVDEVAYSGLASYELGPYAGGTRSEGTGGPQSSHSWYGGLCLDFWATGNRLSRDVIVGYAMNAITSSADSLNARPALWEGSDNDGRKWGWPMQNMARVYAMVGNVEGPLHSIRDEMLLGMEHMLAVESGFQLFQPIGTRIPIFPISGRRGYIKASWADTSPPTNGQPFDISGHGYFIKSFELGNTTPTKTFCSSQHPASEGLIQVWQYAIAVKGMAMALMQEPACRDLAAQEPYLSWWRLAARMRDFLRSTTLPKNWPDLRQSIGLYSPSMPANHPLYPSWRHRCPQSYEGNTTNMSYHIGALSYLAVLFDGTPYEWGNDPSAWSGVWGTGTGESDMDEAFSLFRTHVRNPDCARFFNTGLGSAWPYHVEANAFPIPSANVYLGPSENAGPGGPETGGYNLSTGLPLHRNPVATLNGGFTPIGLILRTSSFGTPIKSTFGGLFSDDMQCVLGAMRRLGVAEP